MSDSFLTLTIPIAQNTLIFNIHWCLTNPPTKYIYVWEGVEATNANE